jgi:hypothetical protein
MAGAKERAEAMVAGVKAAFVGSLGKPMSIELWLRCTQPLYEHLCGLQDKLKDVEQRQARWTYRGVWRDGTSYVPQNFCTHSGSLWICLAATNAKPGDDASWQLVCKRGRDA